MKKDESAKTKEVVKEAVKELDKEKADKETWANFAFGSVGVFLITAIAMFVMGHIYWGIGLTALTIFQALFIGFRKKINPILFNIVFAIDVVLFLIAVFVIVVVLELY